MTSLAKDLVTTRRRSDIPRLSTLAITIFALSSLAFLGLAWIMTESAHFLYIESLIRELLIRPNFGLAALSALTAGLSIFIVFVGTGGKVLSIPVFFICSLCLFHGMGAALIAPPGHYLPWLMTIGAALSFALGSYLVLRLAPKPNQRLPLRQADPMSNGQRTMTRGFVIAFVTALVLYYVYLGVAPLVEAAILLIADDGSGAQAAIISGRKAQYYDASNYVGQGYFEVIRTAFLPYAALLLFVDHIARYRDNRPPIRARFALSIVVLLGFVGVLMSGQRWPVAFYVISFAIAYIGTVRRVRLRWIIVIGIVTVFVLLVLTVANKRVDVESLSVLDALLVAMSGILYRILIASHGPYFYSFDVFPEKIPFQNGDIWVSDFLAYLPGADLSFGTIYAEAIGMSWGSAPLTILGEASANFGVSGIIGVLFLLGLMTAFVDVRYQRRGFPNTIVATSYLFICIGVVRMNYGSGLGIVSYHLLPIFFFWMTFTALHLLNSIRRRRFGSDRDPCPQPSDQRSAMQKNIN